MGARDCLFYSRMLPQDWILIVAKFCRHLVPGILLIMRKYHFFIVNTKKKKKKYVDSRLCQLVEWNTRDAIDPKDFSETRSVDQVKGSLGIIKSMKSNCCSWLGASGTSQYLIQTEYLALAGLRPFLKPAWLSLFLPSVSFLALRSMMLENTFPAISRSVIPLLLLQY